ncbi:MAG: glycerol-3-phosphate 1-O-acyltransferase PlsY [Rhodovarius sp.]|nr:glycerol-3-phosphate 1-O-acyltransferase PlsY [Rhodovarius sp.]MCX7932136.1 glycerol-3-phosphate 1-O-acyltransferase PlsY [Rhodovarius sp.]MDW8313830.1 glycerol-3-phosphate 1-O-acyltransferase PlsY [Rhodovarius sp.]
MIDALLAGLAAALLGALLGSIPFGLILTRAAGVGDIRHIGSGNIGATNVLRTGRKGLAAATLALDFLKAAGAVWLAALLFGPPFDVVAGVAAVLGHCHPPWLGFRGGKGVASALGVFFALAWPVFLLVGATWLIAARISRISSVGALAGMAMAVLSSLVLAPGPVGIGILCVAAYVVLRHRANIERLITGREPRIGEGQ